MRSYELSRAGQDGSWTFWFWRTVCFIAWIHIYIYIDATKIGSRMGIFFIGFFFTRSGDWFV